MDHLEEASSFEEEDTTSSSSSSFQCPHVINGSMTIDKESSDAALLWVAQLLPQEKHNLLDLIQVFILLLMNFALSAGAFIFWEFNNWLAKPAGLAHGIILAIFFYSRSQFFLQISSYIVILFASLAGHFLEGGLLESGGCIFFGFLPSILSTISNHGREREKLAFLLSVIYCLILAVVAGIEVAQYEEKQHQHQLAQLATQEVVSSHNSSGGSGSEESSVGNPTTTTPSSSASALSPVANTIVCMYFLQLCIGLILNYLVERLTFMNQVVTDDNKHLSASVSELKLRLSQIKNARNREESGGGVASAISKQIHFPHSQALDVILELQKRPELRAIHKDLEQIEKTLRSDSSKVEFDDMAEVEEDVQRWLEVELSVAVSSNAGGGGGGGGGGVFSIMPPTTPKHFRTPQLSLLSDDVRKVLETTDDWDLDTLKLASVSQGRTLSILAHHLFAKHNLFEKLDIDEHTFANFMKNVEDNYKQTPYHNSTHAANVLHDVHYFLVQGDLFRSLTPLHIFAALFAAIIHDVGHEGLNNSFHSSNRTKLSTQYSDRSILEHYHLALGFALTSLPQCDVFEHFPKDRYDLARKLIIDAVLKTDMSTHFAQVSDLQLLVNTLTHKKGEGSGNNSAAGGQSSNNACCGSSVSSVSSSSSSCSSSVLPGTNSSLLPTLVGWENIVNGNEMLLISSILHTADLAHACKPWDSHEQWSARIFREFITQGDLERELGMDVSPFMDRTKTSLNGSQSYFFDFIIVPWFSLFASLYALGMNSPCQTLESICDIAKKNKITWEERNKNGPKEAKGVDEDEKVTLERVRRAHNKWTKPAISSPTGSTIASRHVNGVFMASPLGFGGFSAATSPSTSTASSPGMSRLMMRRRSRENLIPKNNNSESGNNNNNSGDDDLSSSNNKRSADNNNDNDNDDDGEDIHAIPEGHFEDSSPIPCRDAGNGEVLRLSDSLQAVLDRNNDFVDDLAVTSSLVINTPITTQVIRSSSGGSEGGEGGGGDEERKKERKTMNITIAPRDFMSNSSSSSSAIQIPANDKHVSPLPLLSPSGRIRKTPPPLSVASINTNEQQKQQ